MVGLCVHHSEYFFFLVVMKKNKNAAHRKPRVYMQDELIWTEKKNGRSFVLWPTVRRFGICVGWGGGKIVKAVQVYKWQVRNVTAHFPKNAAVSPSVCSAVLEHIRPA